MIRRSVYCSQECDEQILKELNDEQLFKLLEEAYHSKKLDEKNKSSIFKVNIHIILSISIKLVKVNKIGETILQKDNFVVNFI